MPLGVTRVHRSAREVKNRAFVFVWFRKRKKENTGPCVWDFIAGLELITGGADMITWSTISTPAKNVVYLSAHVQSEMGSKTWAVVSRRPLGHLLSICTLGIQKQIVVARLFTG